MKTVSLYLAALVLTISVIVNKWTWHESFYIHVLQQEAQSFNKKILCVQAHVPMVV